MNFSKKQKGFSFANRAQLWDFFMLFFVTFVIIFGVVYFFVYKFNKIPKIETNRGFVPAERGVLPKGTFFK